jgi:hypothetical protein
MLGQSLVPPHLFRPRLDFGCWGLGEWVLASAVAAGVVGGWFKFAPCLGRKCALGLMGRHCPVVVEVARECGRCCPGCGRPSGWWCVGGLRWPREFQVEGRADFQLGMYSGVNGTGCCLVPVLRHRVGFRWLRLPVNNPWAQTHLGVRVCSRGGGDGVLGIELVWVRCNGLATIRC